MSCLIVYIFMGVLHFDDNSNEAPSEAALRSYMQYLHHSEDSSTERIEEIVRQYVKEMTPFSLLQ